MQLFNKMNVSSDTEGLFVDGSIVRAHQHAMGARGHKNEAINRSCGGHSTKIHLAVDSYGLPNRFFDILLCAKRNFSGLSNNFSLHKFISQYDEHTLNLCYQHHVISLNKSAVKS